MKCNSGKVSAGSGAPPAQASGWEGAAAPAGTPPDPKSLFFFRVGKGVRKKQGERLCPHRRTPTQSDAHEEEKALGGPGQGGLWGKRGGLWE